MGLARQASRLAGLQPPRLRDEDPISDRNNLSVLRRRNRALAKEDDEWLAENVRKRDRRGVE